LLCLLALPVVLAAEPKHMVLLAVHEGNGTLRGSTADLFLETQPGKGRVFLETFPLTQIDTQISTRFAKEIACNYFDLRCSETDFIYTIKSSSSIIGGPSAGAALAALTAANVLGLDINESIAVTGTINSGGLIGPVGGVKAKIEAAAESGIETVLIPSGNVEFEEKNKTVDLIAYGEELGIEVAEVIDLNDVVEHFTLMRILEDGLPLEADPLYLQIMGELSNMLCGRTAMLRDELGDFELNISDAEYIENRTLQASKAESAGSFYSSASYCFGLNIRLRRLLYDNQNLSYAKIQAKARNLEVQVNRLENDVQEMPLETITDLQTFTIVIERLNEAKDALERVNDSDDTNDLAFAEERFFSRNALLTRFSKTETKHFLHIGLFACLNSPSPKHIKQFSIVTT